MAEGVGIYRKVGNPDRDLPEDHVFPLDTADQRQRYVNMLADMKARDARTIRVYRLAPGEPKVKRFLTLEDANADWERCAMRAAGKDALRE
ncbi:MAG: hypothetical protein PHG39_10960 [Acidithiobacillus ferrooxidans]|uniref:hypothetical protein n=1 Tax=Acidithiobacillus ferrooxidans TaxID=920 RepID=UPI001C06D658|nr:hypothetical protein [Acidithiobacillus ferrooxidans]MDD5004051.1 hypothetical protein [Acidithiobacillus sp.]MBU2857704.1 hypothetical protein [Acidithiobacillus ferrooxidans]MBU2861977.1 hypothetical protein [Acidithiobacillus ferrooxidans]MDD2748054.1 hypothetical protein [Acidithiobacillus ferrooxidans]MDD5379794.1 hypothetical protein [Acidithiobacillus sp.]